MVRTSVRRPRSLPSGTDAHQDPAKKTRDNQDYSTNDGGKDYSGGGGKDYSTNGRKDYSGDGGGGRVTFVCKSQNVMTVGGMGGSILTDGMVCLVTSVGRSTRAGLLDDLLKLVHEYVLPHHHYFIIPSDRACSVQDLYMVPVWYQEERPTLLCREFVTSKFSSFGPARNVLQWTHSLYWCNGLRLNTYNLETGQTSLISMPSKRNGRAIPRAASGLSITLVRDSIIVVGGIHMPSNEGLSDLTNSVDRYHMTLNKWTSCRPLPLPTEGHSTASFNWDGHAHVMCVGGAHSRTIPQTNSQPPRQSDTCFVLDVDKNIWRQLASMNELRAGASCVIVGNRVYVTGGFLDIGQEYLKTTEYLDLPAALTVTPKRYHPNMQQTLPEQARWKRLPQLLPSGCSTHAAFADANQWLAICSGISKNADIIKPDQLRINVNLPLAQWHKPTLPPAAPNPPI